MTAQTASAIQVLVVEDSPFTRRGITAVLQTEPGVDVIGEVCNGADALVAFAARRPDVVLTDICMPNMDGVALTRELCRQDPPGRVLVLSDYDGEHLVTQALRAGASGYLSKGGITADELMVALRAVCVGETYLPPAISARLSQPNKRLGLSPRELQVIERVSLGQSNQEIADDLAISKRTVGMFVSKILFKLGARTRADAVTKAVERGILAARRG
jgi:DNA-binding NarL/FixJ family response regulator